MSSHFQSRRKASQRGEDGYVLLVLLLTVALMIIGMAVIVPSIAFQIRRDREEEMIHRGVQYSRAIRAYYKKFGRYPTKLEDLENTNNLRFLRKRYKDPITGQDFKLLHYGEVKLSFGGGIGGIAPGVGGALAGAAAAGGLGGLSGAGGFGQPSAFGGGGSAFGGASGFGQSSTLGATGGFVANSNSPFSQNQVGNNPTQGTDSSQDTSQQTGSNQSGTGAGSNNPGSTNQPVQTFGGGPIVGVVSTSKKPTIREFNNKKKYNEWQFVYDPTADRGGLITTPYQPALQGFASPQNLNPQAGNSNGSSGSSFGNSFGNSFGQPMGMSNNPNSMGGQNPPAQPPSTSPQQQ